MVFTASSLASLVFFFAGLVGEVEFGLRTPRFRFSPAVTAFSPELSSEFRSLSVVELLEFFSRGFLSLISSMPFTPVPCLSSFCKELIRFH